MDNFFETNDLILDVWKSKYEQNNESYQEFFLRIAKEFNNLDPFKEVPSYKISKLSEYARERIEKNSLQVYLDLFSNFKYIIPGGSVLAGVGTNKLISLSNCFVLGTEDSIDGILGTATDMSQIYKRRGGVGTDLSKLRPKGSKVNNAAKTTSGVVPFMELYSQVTNTIGQEGRRK